MRIVVTGASGNVGTALLRRLVAAGHEVVGVSRRRPPDVAPYAQAQWRSLDVSSADTELIEAVTGADAVVHLAWLIQPSWNRELLRRVNQDGSRAVLEAVIAAGVPHLVHQSSIGAYAPAPGRTVDERWPSSGIATSAYSVDKAAVERMLDEQEHALTIARMRPTLILQDDAAAEIGRYFLGPFVPKRVIGPKTMRLLPWPRALALQFVHADDVAAAIEAVLLARASGAFNVAAEPVIDRETYASIFGRVGPALPPRVLRTAAEASWRVHLQPTDGGWVDLAMGLPLLDTARLRGLGWVPRHPGDVLLARFVEALGRGSGARGPLLYPRGAGSGF